MTEQIEAIVALCERAIAETFDAHPRLFKIMLACETRQGRVEIRIFWTKNLYQAPFPEYVQTRDVVRLERIWRNRLMQHRAYREFQQLLMQIRAVHEHFSIQPCLVIVSHKAERVSSASEWDRLFPRDAQFLRALRIAADDPILS